MASEKTPPADLTALAAEALDLWQEHLSTYAADPKAKKEMMRLMEPSRRLFADWAAMMQHGPYGTGTRVSAKSAPAAAGSAAARPASDDGALRVAQLAHRVAELEKRLAELESGGVGKAAKTGKPSAKPKSGV